MDIICGPAALLQGIHNKYRQVSWLFVRYAGIDLLQDMISQPFPCLFQFSPPKLLLHNFILPDPKKGALPLVMPPIPIDSPSDLISSFSLFSPDPG